MARVKLKSHRGAAKRFKITGSGKVVSRPAGRRHLLECKSKARKRALRKRGALIAECNQESIKRLLPYS